ncbi:MAG TPA: GxxExxY protein [Terriglobia bacterium]|nr:GxxExxY protein [Terriglobia bacterium]
MQPYEPLVFRIVEAARAVHQALGPGFIESIYSRALIAELKNNGFQVEREKPIKIWYASSVVGKHLLDVVVDGTVIVELKANRGIIQIHMAQMNSYLHATDYAVGIILNFGMPELEFELIESPHTMPNQPDK